MKGIRNLAGRASLTFAAVGVSVAVSAAAVVRSIDVKTINDAVAKIINPINKDGTRVAAEILSAAVDSNRATNVEGFVSAIKNGPVPAGVTVKYAYSYPEAKDAMPELDASAKLSAENGAFRQILVNLGIKADQFDQFFIDTQKEMQELAKAITHQYGNAVNVGVRVTGVTLDSKKHYLSEKVIIQAAVDMNKLPNGVKPDSVYFRTAQIVLDINLDHGADLSGGVVMNPEFKDFRKDQQGLKEFLEALEKKDPKALNEIKDFASMAGYFIDAATKDPSKASLARFESLLNQFKQSRLQLLFRLQP